MSQAGDITFLCLTHLVCKTQTKMVVTTQRGDLGIKAKRGHKATGME